MEFRYIFLFEKKQPVGFSYCQIYPFSARESIKSLRSDKNSESFIKTILASWVEFTAFVCGNLLLTGQCGYYFKPDYQGREMNILFPVWKQYFESERKKNRRVSIQFIKDLPDAGCKEAIDYLEQHDYFRFKVQPAMLMKIDPVWQNFEDYLDALKSKYRVRMRQALKKSANLVKRECELEEMIENRSRFQELLNNVLEESDFRIVEFDIDYLIEIKKNLGNSFRIRTYHVEDQLIGFMTYFICPEKVLAHFTGFETRLNKKLDIYLNMLIDLVEQSIQLKTLELDFSRTALEIKSSVGAVPIPMSDFLWHFNCTKHKLLPKLFRSLYTPEEWTQRRPFKNNLETK